MVDVLEDIILKDTGIVLKTLPSKSVGLKLTHLYRNLDVLDREVTVTEVANSIRVKMGLMPFSPSRSSAALIRNKYSIPIVEAEMSFNHEDYQLMKKSVYTPEMLANDIKSQMQKTEGQLILTSTADVYGDNMGIANTNNHTAITTHLIANDYNTGIVTFGKAINQMLSTLEEGDKELLRANTVVLIVTPDVIMDMAITYNSDYDKTLLTAVKELLKGRCGAGSTILESTFLGNSITMSEDEGVISVSTTTKKAAFVIIHPSIMTTHASPIDPRPRDYNKVDGFYTKWVERFVNLVHNVKGILYDNNVTVST